jgi:hypothetical protein
MYRDFCSSIVYISSSRTRGNSLSSSSTWFKPPFFVVIP